MPLMDDNSKLTLSDEELQLVNNSDWILTKHIIIGKVYHLFGNLATTMKAAIDKEYDWLPAEAVRAAAKISKGENYLKLPYVLLDYPRCFDAENIFAVRTLFWWGNFFSITLHLSGRYKEMFAENICNNKEGLEHDNFFICISEDEWQHHFEANNYRPVREFDKTGFNRIVTQKRFIKLAVKFTLKEWKDMSGLLELSFGELVKIIKT
jgi:hypothetical protein